MSGNSNEVERGRLRALAGAWEGEERIHPAPWAPEGGTRWSRMELQPTGGGLWLAGDLTSSADGEVVYDAHVVLGFEPDAERYVRFWFDAAPPFDGHRAEGGWSDDHGIELIQESPAGRGRTRMRLDGEELIQTIEIEGEAESWGPFAECRYRRA